MVRHDRHCSTTTERRVVVRRGVSFDGDTAQLHRRLARRRDLPRVLDQERPDAKRAMLTTAIALALAHRPRRGAARAVSYDAALGASYPRARAGCRRRRTVELEPPSEQSSDG